MISHLSQAVLPDLQWQGVHDLWGFHDRCYFSATRVLTIKTTYMYPQVCTYFKQLALNDVKMLGLYKYAYQKSYKQYFLKYFALKIGVMRLMTEYSFNYLICWFIVRGLCISQYIHHIFGDLFDQNIYWRKIWLTNNLTSWYTYLLQICWVAMHMLKY